MKFIHCADIHLDSPLRGLERHEGAPVEEARNASRRAFEALIGLAIEEAVDFVLIAGDLFDGAWRDFNTALYFVRQTTRLQEAGIRLFLTRGNHDAESRFARQLHLPDNVHAFSANRAETVLLDGSGVAIHGRSFSQPAERENLALGFPPSVAGRYNIGLLHTALDGREGHAPYAPCLEADLVNKGYDYWALGHVHQWEVVRGGQPWILFPGMLQGRHVRESGPKGCALVEVDGDFTTRVRFRALDVLRWSRVELDCGAAADGEGIWPGLRERLARELKQAEGRLLAVRLILTGSSALEAQLFRRGEGWREEARNVALELSGGSIWVERILFRVAESRRDVPLAVEALADLEAVREELEGDPVALEALFKGLFADLRGFLPAAACDDGEEGLRFEDPGWRQELLRRASALAVARLTGEES